MAGQSNSRAYTRPQRLINPLKRFTLAKAQQSEKVISQKGAPMHNYRKLAEQLVTSLKLSLPPIAVAFSDAVPPNVPAFVGTVPAGCAFWQEAATRTFSTTTKDHELCSIGVHTHNMTQPSELHQTELQETLQAMIGMDYVRVAELKSIPVLKRQIKHAIYGPLLDFPVCPEVVLLFANSRQGLILSEAVGRVDGGAPPAMGRPACAVVPRVINEGRAALSLGCCGARAYLDIMSDGVALWALPAEKLDKYAEQISVLARANAALTVFHVRRREEIESGVRPSVRESLERCVS
jgi:uncharacterized protein (DUF169 family)